MDVNFLYYTDACINVFFSRPEAKNPIKPFFWIFLSGLWKTKRDRFAQQIGAQTSVARRVLAAVC
jgi:hypothetical protein